MHYRISVAALALACAAVTIGSPGTRAENTGIEPGTEDNGLSICEEHYLALYAEAQAKFGSAVVGANAVDDGTGPHPAYDLPESLCEQKAATLDAMLNPAPAPSESGTPTETVESAYSPSAGGGYASAATVQCESGGDYSINTGNGYYGAYQFDSGTWDAYGDPAYPEASDAPPAVQDAAAASVPYDAWPNC